MSTLYYILPLLLFALSAVGLSSKVIGNDDFVANMKISKAVSQEAWDYVTVRPKAHMFYWLYYTTHSSGFQNRPLIMWLQGGPGGSGTGFGNFEELGPLDVNLKPRNTTWLQTASLLFVDNPVGTGYSYAEDVTAFVTTNDEIAEDMMVLLKTFAETYPKLQNVPFYIFSESYGGKMAASISAYLYEAVMSGVVKLNFKGFAMGDSWISPVDSTLSWGPFLHATSIVSKSGMEKINKGAQKVAQFIKEGKFQDATIQWGTVEGIVTEESSGVDFYNIMNWGNNGLQSHKHKASKNMNFVDRLYHRLVLPLAGDDLNYLMNGPIKKKLGIIPKNVTWGGQSSYVFHNLTEDFMKNVTSVVNDLIINTPLKVIVYSGQLDLICDVLGTEAWFYRLDVAESFKKSEMEPFTCNTTSRVCYFRKQYKNVEFYWILDAGHMVPKDNGPGALSMVNKIIGS